MIISKITTDDLPLLIISMVSDIKFKFNMAKYTLQCESAWTAITKCHGLGDLNSGNFLTVLELEVADSVSDEDSGLQMITLSLYPLFLCTETK